MFLKLTHRRPVAESPGDVLKCEIPEICVSQSEGRSLSFQAITKHTWFKRHSVFSSHSERYKEQLTLLLKAQHLWVMPASLSILIICRSSFLFDKLLDLNHLQGSVLPEQVYTSGKDSIVLVLQRDNGAEQSYLPSKPMHVGYIMQLPIFERMECC